MTEYLEGKEKEGAEKYSGGRTKEGQEEDRGDRGKADPRNTTSDTAGGASGSGEQRDASEEAEAGDRKKHQVNIESPEATRDPDDVPIRSEQEPPEAADVTGSSIVAALHNGPFASEGDRHMGDDGGRQ